MILIKNYKFSRSQDFKKENLCMLFTIKLLAGSLVTQQTYIFVVSKNLRLEPLILKKKFN